MSTTSFPLDAFHDLYNNDLVVLDRGSKFWVSLPCKLHDVSSEDGRLVLYEDKVGTEGSYVYRATVREPIELLATTVKSVIELIECVVAVHNYQNKSSLQISDLQSMLKYTTTERTYDGYAVKELLKQGKDSSDVYYLTNEASKKVHISGEEVFDLSYRINTIEQ